MFVDPVLVHCHSTEYHRFIRHTPATFKAACDHLKYVAQHMTATRLVQEQRAVGIKYDPDSLVQDEEVREAMEMPYCMVSDWMHHFVGSGGIAQYELNQLLRVMVRLTPLRVTDIDEWKNTVRLPRGLTRLTKTFFADRIVDRDGAHIRGFASEILTATVLLGFFVDVVVKDVAASAVTTLQPYIDCFDLLRILLNIFEHGDVAEIGVARDVMHSHHVLFARLYPICMKLKVHGQVHIIDFWEYWQRLLSCFGPERHHLIMKRCMAFSYKKAADTALAYDVRIWLNNLENPALYEPVHLAGTVHTAATHVEWPGLPAGMTITAWAVSLKCEQGTFHKSDLLQ